MKCAREARSRRACGARHLIMAAVTLAGAVGTGGTAQAREAEMSDNVGVVASFPFEGATDIWTSATDIDFSGRYAYVGRWNSISAPGGATGGVYIFDVGSGSPKQVGFVPCPGGQNDVAVVEPGVIALGYHESACGHPDGGVTLIDVRNPNQPRILGSVHQAPYGTHTLTKYPGKPLIYASPGGWGYETEWSGGGNEYIIDVSNPHGPRVVATFDPQTAGCHDLSFHMTKEESLAFCAGDTMTQIWDVADPLKPRVISNIVNPLSGFNHSAEATSDGTLLAVGEETSVDDCAQGIFGSIWFWDISIREAPRLAGYYSIPRGSPTEGLGLEYTCSAHNYRFIPDTRQLVASWFQAGMNILDVTNPASAKEVAYYMPDEGTYWSAYWYEGRVYASGVPGFDVLDINILDGRRE